jgi:hypothetical protein
MPTTRININDYLALGRLIATWSKEPGARPADIAAMRTALAGIAHIPSRITKLEYVQADLHTMLMRLPNAQMLQESEDMFAPTGAAANTVPGYQIPTFYGDALGFSAQPTPLLTTLYSRIADYTIAQCR